MKIPLAKPEITAEDRKAVEEVLKTPYLSLGPKVKEFEKCLARYIDVKYVVAVSSGTAGLHLIIRALGIGKGDEVITTPFSFIASANCILQEGAKPVFADIDPETLNIDPEKVEEKITKKTKAILAVDIFGQPADWQGLKKIAKKHKLYLIEDSAEALGSEFRGKKCGTFGEAGIFSFYPNKQITSSEGGCIVTNNKKIAALCQSMANQGRKLEGDRWLEHIRLGYNYRLSDIQCALLISQLKRIKKILRKRAEIAFLYNKKLKNFPELTGVQPLLIGPGVKMSWFVYVIRLNEKYSRKDRDLIIKKLGQTGIEARNYFFPIHLQPFYKKMFGLKRGDLPICEKIADRTIALPFYNNLKEKEIDFVIKNLSKILREILNA